MDEIGRANKKDFEWHEYYKACFVHKKSLDSAKRDKINICV